MKTTKLSLAFVAFCLATAVFAHAAASFSWIETSHDFGKIQKGKPVVASFEFKNSGTQPLVISQAVGSCGCTGVEFSKDPILPNQTGSIKATFNAAVVGPFSKSVTVTSNAETGVVVLKIHGEVFE
ncbi:DUF1573 domain-containing protein [Arundinibacter roseus]|uniref:DUF1573 domain-containing protein n=1 Tax=Arundinibacter roseus TaxID=2070510 RepID=A0A4R4KQM9_9BACT|nr:DUF1573 domain-containing protein [Arundinibacter roseus]TDB69232.1 DUF1573 domain-containing protein [Arundinibacter roseus]